MADIGLLRGQDARATPKLRISETRQAADMMRVASGSITSTLQSPSLTLPSISSCAQVQQGKIDADPR